MRDAHAGDRPGAARPAPGRPRAGRAATLLSTAGDEAGTSLLPAFLSGTLGAAPVVLGVVEGLANAADGVARLGGGPLAEDPRRRRIISIGGSAGMAAMSALIAFASSPWQVGALRAGASSARGLRSPQRYAAVPERAGAAGYGRAFGFERGVHHLAALTGPLLAFALLALLGVRSALLGAVIPAALGVGIGLLAVRGTARPAAPAQRPKLAVRAVYRGPLGRLMTGITIFEFANFAAVLLILRATKLLEAGDVPFGAAQLAVLLYVLWRLGAAVCCLACGRLVDRHGSVPVMAGGILTLLVAYAGFAFVGGAVLEIAACFLLAGAATGAVEAAEHVGVAQLAPEKLRWSAFGALSAVRSFGRMSATLVAATIWTLLGPAFGLLFAVPVMGVALAVMVVGPRERSRPPTRGRRRRRAVRAVVAGTAVGAVASAGVVLAMPPSDAPPPAPAAGPADGPAPEGVARVQATVAVGRGPDGLGFDRETGRVLVTDAEDGTLTRLDARTGRVAGPAVPVGADADGVVAGGDVLWVAAAGADGVRRITPAGASLHPTGRRPEGVALDARVVWVANGGDDTVSRLDRSTGRPVGPPIRVGRAPTAIAVAGGTAWVTNKDDGTVTRIDTASGQVAGTPIRVGRAPRGIAVADGLVWVAVAGEDAVVRLDARTGRPRGAPIAVGDNPRDLAAGSGAIWVTNHGDDTVTAIDRRRGVPAQPAVRVGAGPLGITAAAGSVWVANHDDGTVSRLVRRAAPPGRPRQ